MTGGSDSRLRAALHRFGTTGGLAFAALAVAVVTGIALAVAFDVRRPYESLALLLLGNPGGRVLRNLHYWSAQFFLVLTLAHAWRHVARPLERRLTFGVWTRAVLSLPLAAFLMLSGFILKGDAEGLQALRILSTTIEHIPLAGGLLAALVFGTDPSSLQVLYVNHVATATCLAWLLVAEHARSIWPRLPAVFLVAGLSAAAALMLTPALHDGLEPVLKGPWYFVGLQEILHAATRPLLVTSAGALLVAVLVALPRLTLQAARRARLALGLLAAIYAALTVFALSFRGDSWALVRPVAPWAGLTLESPLGEPVVQLAGSPIPVVLGRPEGCLYCHRDTRGMSASHSPAAVGCASCHAGHPFSLDRVEAHRGLIRIPGNLDAAARTCGSAACHPGQVERVRASIMTTMRGVIGVDRQLFGESPAGRREPIASPAALGSTAADTHLRQLCASCHLGAVKRDPGSVKEASRGGGCNACHLTYGREATHALEEYARARAAGRARADLFVHPDLSVRTTNDHCFGCHSRSGRISTSYEGWQESEPGSPAPAGPTRTLSDGRVFTRVAPDVHFEKGLACVDCHTAREVMGDLVAHARKAEQLTVSCEDCHAARPAVERHDRIGAESQRVLAVRGRFSPGARVLVAARSRDPLVATFVDASGRPRLVASASGAVLDLRPPAPACARGGGHARLGCIACHAAWAPRCSGCHTSFDPGAAAFDHVAGAEVQGAWTEAGSDFRAEPPTLGVRQLVAPDGGRAEAIETFVPGMVLTVDRNRRPGHPPDVVFRRAYARAFSHTVSARSRSCTSCHNDPVALGYGRGALVYARVAGGGRWSFTPSSPASPFDGLPADAWIGFLERAPDSRSTRPDVRPFAPEEQKRILAVGACLTCHAPESRPMQDAIADFGAVVRRVSPSCAIPAWPAR